MAKIIILDYSTPEVRVVGVDDHNKDSEQVEKILTEQYEYSLDNIEWMVVDELKLRIE